MKPVIVSVCSLGLAMMLLPVAAQRPPCDRGNTKNSAYMFRENQKRCEGITTKEVARGDFDISSLTIGQLQSNRRLTLRVPKVANLPKPQMRVQAAKQFYELIPLELTNTGSQWQFDWSDEVLRSENILPDSLRSFAEAGNVLLPVLFSRGSKYNIRIYTGGARARTITLRLLARDGQSELYRQTLRNQPSDEVLFVWDGRDQRKKVAPTGQYTIKVEAQLEQRNAPPETRTRTRQLFHNPAWLK